LDKDYKGIIIYLALEKIKLNKLSVNHTITLFNKWELENSILTIVKQEIDRDTVVFLNHKIRKVYLQFALDLFVEKRTIEEFYSNVPSCSSIGFNLTTNPGYKYERILIAENHIRISRFLNNLLEVTYDIIK